MFPPPLQPLSAPHSLSACSFRSGCRAAMSWLLLWLRCLSPYASSWASRILPCRQASWPALPLRWRAMLYLTEEVPAMPVNEFLVLWLSSWAAIAFFRIAPAFALRGRTLSPRITEALGYPARCLCRAGRQRLGEPRRVRRGTLACLGSLDCGRRRRGRGGQDKIDAVVLRLGHRTLYRLEPYIGVASRAPNLVPSQLVEFFTELVYFFWYHGQTLL